MAVREIIQLGDPRLREKAAPIEVIDDSVRRLVADMLETVRDAPGIGLAATQLAVPLRLIVISLDGDEFELLNPEIVQRSEEHETEVEACLSLPGVQGMVRRAASVVAIGGSVDGDELEIEAEGLAARCLQHEIDHLDGIVFLDHVEDEKVRWYEDTFDPATGEARETVRFIARTDVYAEFEERYRDRVGAEA